MSPLQIPKRRAKRHKVRFTLLAAGLSASVALPAAPAAAEPVFSDVSNDYWAYSYISSLSAKGIVNGLGSQFAPEASVTRAQFAKLLVKARNLPMVRPATPSFTDVRPDSWEYEYIETAYQNGLLNGTGNGRFEPNSLLTREDMAKMTVSSLSVKLQDIRSDIRTRLSFGDSSQISSYAKEYAAVGSYLGLINGQPGNLYAPHGHATRAQAAAIIDRFIHISADKLQSLTLQLQVTATAAPYTAGSNATLSVQVADAKGAIVTADSGRKVALIVSQPIPKEPSDNYTPKKSTYEAVTRNGIAQFNIPVSKAGMYRVEAKAGDLSVKDFTFQVIPAKAEKLVLSATPSPFLLPGSSATIRVQAADRYDNLATDVSGISVSVTMSGQGSLEKKTAILQNGIATFGTFKAGTTAGDVTLNATAGSRDLQADSYTLTVVQDKTQMISGKGIWLMWRDWYRQDTAQLIAEAKKRGITHLYLHIATSADGIFAEDAIDDLIHQAHRNHLQVIGWVYSDLRNPLTDAKRDISVAQYKTPTGDKIDALTTDIEDAIGTTESNVNQYSQAVRAALGNNYPFYATTYPPSMRPNYPWKSFGTYYDAIIPMDYWHVKDRAYTQEEAYNFVKQSIADIRRLTGNPNMPISIAGQGFDAFREGTGANNPSPQEVQGALQAAKDAGAIGFSMYRWGTMTDGQWDVFGSYKW